jgi:hypothetical protein
MPNYVKNIITFEEVSDEQMEEILEAIKNDEYGRGSIDFNKIIPIPEEINNYYSAESHEWCAVNWGTKWNAVDFDMDLDNSLAMKMRQNFRDAGDDISIEEAKETLENEIAFGEVEYSDYINVLEFNTAWNAPHPILEQLTKMYPNILLRHQWADDDFGFNVGTCEYQDDYLIYENIPVGGSSEAYEMAADIAGFSLQELGYILRSDGNYELKREGEKKMDDYKDYYETGSDGPVEISEFSKTLIEYFESCITAVMVKPMEEPKIVRIGSDLKSMQLAVGGMIEVIMPFDEEVAIVCNEEGKLLQLDLNRAIKNQDGEIVEIIAGSFFICNASGDNFSSLNEEQTKRYYELFKNPEWFVSDHGKIRAITINK